MRKTSAQPPSVAPRLLRGFRWIARRSLRKAFHTVAVAGESPSAPPSAPLVVYLNHASWWDPLVGIFLAERLTPDRTLYAPFDADALARYPVFGKLGFFGVDQTSRRGAAQFLQIAQRVLTTPGASLWITPEGRFVDPRDPSIAFEHGLAHLAELLAERSPDAVLAPLAIEYPFWEERLPEVLARFGEPVRVGDHAGLGKAPWGQVLTERLRLAQRELASLAIARDAAAFRVLLGGKAGVGGVYETFRWAHARLTGRAYRAAHGEKFGGG